MTAAGNDGGDAANHCPRAPGIIKVGGLTESDEPAEWSSHGPSVIFWAPGDKVLSASRGNDDAREARRGTRYVSPVRIM